MTFKFTKDQDKLLRAKERYQQFIENELDKKQIIDYFKIGLEAKVFLGNKTHKPLGPNDHLVFGFRDGNYLYTVRRQPLPQRTPIEDLIRKAVLDGMNKQ